MKTTLKIPRRQAPAADAAQLGPLPQPGGLAA